MGSDENHAGGTGTARLRVESVSPGVVALWLDRGAKRNALDRELIAALADAVAEVEAATLVLGAEGDAFCAGLDLSLAADERAACSDLLYDLYDRMLARRGSIVGVIEGAAVGAGAQLALACDLRIGGSAARFRFAGVGHGLAVGAWGLGPTVGRGRALDLCLTMRDLEAGEAARLGFLDRLVEDPRPTALALAGELAGRDGGAVGRAKELVNRDLRRALASEREGNRAAWTGSVEGLGWGRDD